MYDDAKNDLFAKYGGVDAQLLTIDLMEGHDFEYWCADLLRKNGFCNVTVTQGSGDQGVDVLAQKDGIRYAIQCKCYSSDLGNKPIQEVSAGRQMPEYHCQVGAVMTNRHFTKGAKDLAAATGTLLWDRDWIKAHLQSVDNIESDICSKKYDDEMFPAAVDAVLETNQTSIYMLQRKLNLGYARAARIVDEMEERGIVGPFQGAKPRAILITKEDWCSQSEGAVSGHNFQSAEESLDTEPVTHPVSPNLTTKEYDFDMPGDEPLSVKLKRFLEKSSHYKKEKSQPEGTFLKFLKRTFLPIIAYFDTTFFLAALGDLVIGKPTETWHYIYIFFMLIFPIILAIWVRVNKKGNRTILNTWSFWFTFSAIVAILVSIVQI